MSKKKNPESLDNSLKNRLGDDVLGKLASKKNDLKKEQERQEEKKRLELIKERKRKEANKSFEDLLSESELDWKKFK